MKAKGYIYAIISAIFFGSAGIFVKSGYSNNFGPVEILMLQYIIALIILFLFCLLKYRNKLLLSKKMLIKLLIQGAIGNTLMTVFFYSSFKYLEVSTATMLLYTYPAMVAIYSALFLGQRITKRKIFAILGTFLGSLMVLNLLSSNLKSLNIMGICFGILAALFYSFMNIYAEGIVDEIPPMVITLYTTLFSLIILLIFNPSFISKLSVVSTSSIINAASLAFFCEIIPLTLLYAAIKNIGAVTTSIISTLELPSSALFSFFLLNEKLSIIQILGILLAVYSVIMLKKES